jgi:PKD repeat protein
MVNKLKKIRIKYLMAFLLSLFLTNLNAQTLNHPDWGFKDFSASTVYNVTDMTLSGVQSKIDAANANGGGTVIVPAGTVTLNNWLLLKDNVKLKGTLDENGNHLTTFIAEKDAFFDENLFTIIKAAGVTNVTIENIILDGNKNYASGISAIYGAKNVLVANNIVRNIGIAKVETQESSKDMPEYQKSPSGINCWYNDGNTTVRDNVIENVSKHGVGFNRRNKDTQAGKFIVQNNKMNNCYMGMDISSTTQYVEILGNTITDCLYGSKIVNTWDDEYHDNIVYNCDDSPWWDVWIGGWNDGTGVALVLQEAELNNPPLWQGEGTLKNILIKDNVLSSVEGKTQWVFWGVSNPDTKITFINNSSTPPSEDNVTADFSASVISCSPTVRFTNKSIGTITSYLWKFGDGQTSTSQSPEYTYKNSGTYTVELIVSNSKSNDTKTSQISISFAEKPTNLKGEKQGNGTVVLSGSVTSGTINWYDVATGGTPIGTGNNYTTPVTSSSVFYAENRTGDSGNISTGGKTDKGDTGEYYIYEDPDAIWGLAFDAKSDFTLKSVKIYNQGSDYTGSRTFVVKDANGSTIATKDINVVDGEQRLDLNFTIPQGNGYRLLADNPKKGIWRDKTGTTLNFPYDIGGVASITSSVKHDGTVNSENYFFFYDWEITTGGTTCTSERIKVDLVTELGENKENSISIYPNPATNYVYINNLPNSNCNVILYNSSMQQVKSLKSNGSSDLRINFNKLSSGIYFCRVASENNILTMKKIVIVK